MKVYLGHDPKENGASAVAIHSLMKRASIPVDCTLLRLDRLAASGLIRRPVDARGGLYDIHSQAPQSTEFAISRFVVPMLAQQGWALFVDADVVFLEDIRPLMELADSRFAVMVVKHEQASTAETKMVDQIQTRYSRKNWSSVCLWNCDHPANRRLSLDDVNHRPGRDLHAFYWLADSEIGTLPARWNWLVGEQPKPDNPAIAHFTMGGPFVSGWPGAEHDDIWLNEAIG